MIEQARVKSIMANVKYIDGASAGYFQKYGAVPGDQHDATSRLPRCDAAHNCVNGNGNRQIGAPTADYTHDDQAGIAALPQVETAMFWKHLALGDFIIDIDPTSDPAAPAWASTHPAAKGYGGYTVLHNASTTIQPGPYIFFRKAVTGDPLPTAAGLGAVEPEIALQIDAAMDDGKANTGSIQAPSASGLCADNATGEYTASQANETCIMVFKLHAL